MNEFANLSDQVLQEIAVRARKAIFSAEYERFGTYTKAESTLVAVRAEQHTRQSQGEQT